MRLASKLLWAVLLSPAVGRALSDTAIRPSVCLSVPWLSCPRRAAAVGYRHAGCLHLSHVRTADPSAMDIDPPQVELPSTGGGANRLAAPGAITCFTRKPVCTHVSAPDVGLKDLVLLVEVEDLDQ